MYLIAFPLLLVPFVLYNMVAYLLDLSFATTLFHLPLLSGKPMPVSTGDMLVLLGIFLLYVEILKATRLGSKAAMDHILSLLLFIGMLVEFVLAPRAATSTFLLLVALSAIDVLGGFTVSTRRGEREIALEQPDGVATNY
jgi:hypothetical protein